MQAVLVMFRSDGERRSFSIARDMTVIGRREDCDLRIPLGEVSRKHCRLVRDGDTLKLEDLGSSNGTFLNGQRVQEALLSPGDTIQVGPVVFALQIDGEPPEEDLRPVTSNAGGGAEEEVPLGEEDEEAATMESGSRQARGNGAGRSNGAGSPEALDLDELQPVGDSEDAAFDALNSDDAGPGELEIDFDAEEQHGAPPAPPR
jgi:pSer/pThr/pTyr-binding forkhead associated (FHA) protein